MYGFENETYLKVLHGAVDNIEVIKDIIEKVEEKGFDNVFLVGTGGTYSMVSPLAYMLKTNSTLEWYYEIAAELVAAKPKKLGERSLMITASLSGTTKETIAAAEYGDKRRSNGDFSCWRGGQPTWSSVYLCSC